MLDLAEVFLAAKNLRVDVLDGLRPAPALRFGRDLWRRRETLRMLLKPFDAEKLRVNRWFQRLQTGPSGREGAHDTSCLRIACNSRSRSALTFG
jgi:hypothetical protein